MVAEIHTGATLTPTKTELLASWVPKQRWFSDKSSDGESAGASQLDLVRISAFRLEDPDGEVGIEVLFLRDAQRPDGTIYQVPVTYRSEPLEGAEHALIGTAEHSELGKRWVYDAPHDPVFARALWNTIRTEGRQSDRSDGVVEMTVQGRTTGVLSAYDADVASSRVLTGEQSNTSIIYSLEGTGDRADGTVADGTVADGTVADGTGSDRTASGATASDAAGSKGEAPQRKGVIAKLFRVLNIGANPDIELTSALTEAGNPSVPALVGSLHASFRIGRHSNVRHEGDIAFVQEFLPNVRDAWREALEAARENRDFSEPARELGRTTASVHRELAAALGAAEPSTAEKDAVIESMTARAHDAFAAAPDVARHEASISERYERLRSTAWPALQRIHGDFHLGQVLDVPGRGWVLLDFEGEPLRPISERSQPDSPVRDVAGMLRSFDYAAGTVETERPGESRREWARACSTAFLSGYENELGASVPTDILDAFVLDKALYEVTYEARNRPDWLTIPVGALERIVSGTQSPDAEPVKAPSKVPEPEPNNERPAIPAERLDEPKDKPKEAPMSTTPIPATVDVRELQALVSGEHRDPHRVLGAHLGNGTVTFRVIRPMAKNVAIVLGDERIDLSHESDGVWVGACPGEHMPDYRIATTYADGTEHVADDPYRFMPSLGDIDIHLIGEGRHEQLWKVLGARVHTFPSLMGEVRGTAFTVWAPNAKAVRVVGDFNFWDGVAHPMRVLGSSGIWELFVPGATEGSSYKFEILCSDGVRRTKADPMARLAETAPATASKVTSSSYEWNDTEWMAKRAATDPHTAAMSTYEVHLGSWRKHHSYRDLAEHLVNYVKDLGFTHVEMMPVMEHPYPPSWGYHVTSYYAPNSRFGDPDDFKYLVDRLHQAGIGVILDWVPGHFATDEWALAKFDGSALYEHPDPRRGWHPEWGSNIFDFGRPQVRNFLVANALYWLEEFHADGLRVDGVASMLYLDYARSEGEWEPNKYGGRENLEAVQLLQETNATAYKRTPGAIVIAEESTSWPGITRPTNAGGLGFGLKWNMGWMHDSLDYFAHEPVHRQYHHNELTFALTYAYSENFVLPISHDEVVHGKGSLLRKMPGDRWQQLANVRAFLSFMWAHPGKQLLFMGSEFAQEAEWADGRELDWWLLDQPAHYGIHALVKDLNRLYTSRSAMWSMDHAPEGFRWLNADDAGRNAYTWLRFGQVESDGYRPVIAVALNAAGAPHEGVRIGLPHGGTWNEILNTDAECYGGSGVGNLGSVTAEPVEWDGQPYSAVVTLPPLGAVWFEPASRPKVDEHIVSPTTASAPAQGTAAAASLSAERAAAVSDIIDTQAEGDSIGSDSIEGDAITSAAASNALLSDTSTPAMEGTAMTNDSQKQPESTDHVSLEKGEALIQGAPLEDTNGSAAPITDGPVGDAAEELGPITGTPGEGLKETDDGQ